MSTPQWRAPISGNSYNAGDITQFEFSHPGAFLYQGTARETGATRTGTLNTNTGSAAQWIAQPFTTAVGQTTVTRVELDFLIAGTGADLTIDLQTDNGSGNPSGTALYSITFPLDFLPASHALVGFPFNASNLTASTKYHIVVHGTASTSNYAELGDGTTVTNQALTSATGSSWSGAGKSLVFNVFSGVNGVIRNTIEDGTPTISWQGAYASGTTYTINQGVTSSGIAYYSLVNSNLGNTPATSPTDWAPIFAPIKWTGLDYVMGSAATSGPPTTLREYVGALRSVRTIAYSAGLPTTVT